jgi:type IV secretory pathway VirJ component
MLCIYGSDEKESGCRGLDATHAQVIEREGGHRVHCGYDQVIEDVAGFIARRP